MKYAYFNPSDNVVLQWIDTEERSYILPDSSLLHECTDAEWDSDRSRSWMVKSGRVVLYVAPTTDAAALLSSAKANGNDRINSFAKSKRALIAGTSDDAEIAGWNNKLRIAQAIGAGTATDAEKAAFQAEITARGIKGETLDIFTQKVIKNAAFFAQAVGLIDGLKRKGQDAVNAAKTPDEVTAVLAAIKQQAEAAFTTLMGGK